MVPPLREECGEYEDRSAGEALTQIQQWRSAWQWLCIAIAQCGTGRRSVAALQCGSEDTDPAEQLEGHTGWNQGLLGEKRQAS